VQREYPAAGPVLAERPPREVAALHARLAQSEQRIDDLEREVSRLRSREAELQQALADPARGTPAPQTAVAADDGEAERLRAALADEQERRQAVETQLARLREETTSPPLPAAATDIAALQQEVSTLRQQLADERAAREELGRQLAASQRKQERQERGGMEEAPPEELRARVRALEDERTAIVASFNRNLAASDQRIAELDARLATAERTAGNAAALQQDNADLRARLDEERRRTDALAAKLRVAERITDLIFKIQTQQGARPGAPGPPAPTP